MKEEDCPYGVWSATKKAIFLIGCKSNLTKYMGVTNMNIVHIGAGTTRSEIEHITEMRDAGHDYFVPGDSTCEQTVRRIMDADEIHIWDLTREFELGMVYFFSVHALHHKLNWCIKLFGDGRDGGNLSTVFRNAAGTCLTCGGRGRIRHWYAMDELGWIRCPDCPNPNEAKAMFVPPCHGPCNDCADKARCDQLRAEHDGNSN